LTRTKTECHTHKQDAGQPYFFSAACATIRVRIKNFKRAFDNSRGAFSIKEPG
jgi:hypothetical protein